MPGFIGVLHCSFCDIATKILCQCSNFAVAWNTIMTTVIFIILVIIVFALLFTFRYNIEKQIGKEKAEYKAQLSFSLPPTEVFSICLTSLTAIQKTNIKYQNKSEGKIVAKLPSTWSSIGETITFQIEKREKGLTSLIVIAVPFISPAVQSATYNFENAEKIIAYLRQYSNVDIT
jgi:hypothetical protein